MSLRDGENDQIPDSVVAELIKEAVEKGNDFTFTARGTSMRPAIFSGARVTVKRIEKFPPPAGTICVGISGGKLFCHRFIRAERCGKDFKFVLKGDNNPREDAPYEKDQILGKVEEVSYGPVVLKMNSPLLKLVSAGCLRFPSLCRFSWRVVARIGKTGKEPLKKMKSIINILILKLRRAR